MEREIDRRTFLKGAVGAALGVGAVLLLPRSIEGHEPPPGYEEPLRHLDQPLTIESAQDLAIETAEALEQLHGHYPLIKNMRDVEKFRDEIVPYFALIDYVKDRDLIYPDIRTSDYGDEISADMDFRLLGRSWCVDVAPSAANPEGIDGDENIDVNERYFEPYSEMSTPEKNPMLVHTLTHEIAHSNDVSCKPRFAIFGDYDMVEGTTEIASNAVLAAAVMDGSNVALPAFLSQMSKMARGYVLTALNAEGREDEYEAFLDRFPNHSELVGRWRLYKATGQAASSRGAARDYAYRPLVVINEALQRDDARTGALPVPTETLKLETTREVLGNLSHYVHDRIT